MQRQAHADEFANILLEASSIISTAKGGKIYAIGKDPTDLNAIYVTEIWESKDRGNSLDVSGVKELISKVMPILHGQPSKGQELQNLGAAGI